MEENKDSGGDPGTPGKELTREQVMAQRAEKKKIKEARKNKSLTTTDGATPEPSPQAPKANKGQQQKLKGETPEGKQPQQQKSDTPKGKQQKQKSAETPDGKQQQKSGTPKGKQQKQQKSGADNKTASTKEEEMKQEFDEFHPQQTSSPKDPSQDTSSRSPGNPPDSASPRTINTICGSPESTLNSSDEASATVLRASSETLKKILNITTESPDSTLDSTCGSPETTVYSTFVPPDTPEESEASTDASPGQSSTLKPPTEESKAGTPERSSGSKSIVDFQSTIQSLFTVNAAPTLAKDLTFQLHPLFHNLGVKLIHNVIRGTNQRCVKLLETIKEYVRCYETPSGMSFKHGLSNDLQMNMDALRRKCPFAIGMNNAVEYLTAFLYKLDQDVKDIHEQKDNIRDEIDVYVEEKIEKAVEAIVLYGVEKVRSGDVIMIYSITEAVLNLLEKAAKGDEGEEGKSFELIIIQTPETMLDIPVLLKKLDEPIKKRSVTISSVNFSNAIYRMRHCTKIVIGGHGLFTTGGVMAQSGSGKLALLASTFNKPAIFLCETYKFCDRSPLDFFTLDEYIAEQSITEDGLFEPKIKYDVTPANLVTVVITDIDMLPSTSVPVVLRVQEGRAPKKIEDSFEASC